MLGSVTPEETVAVLMRLPVADGSMVHVAV